MDAHSRALQGIAARERARAKERQRRCQAAARMATVALRAACGAVDRVQRAAGRVAGSESDRAIGVENAAYNVCSHHRNCEQLARRTQGAVRRLDPRAAESFAQACEQASQAALDTARMAEGLAR